ncbi:hypothetical protein AEP_00652 [Curvibacter sp. AEP1-3]|uniref:hypothetical protein n=1 Tax=Curvibacter sp. AEP1-3 TaxID=1844971 RepID=UPI000B3CE951|nr:hypothetical protein [Curvibacter sp. AEP1-3]ARV17612.1 hypothetical protein AEP_00652 [Curvibacter sp. AEP1-3]
MAKASNASSDQIRFQELLPFFVNGTLAGEELVWFQQQVSLHPEMQTAVQAERLWAQHIQAAVDAVEAPISETEHMEGLYVRWQARRQRASCMGRARQALATPWQVPAAWVGAGAATLLGQLAVIAALLGGTATAPMRGVTQTCQAEPLLRITFKPELAWQDVVVLLRTQGWMLRNGPSENGYIWVAVPSVLTPEAAQAVALNNPMLESVQLVPASKTESCVP